MDCHPGPSRAKVESLLESPRVNAYTIEKQVGEQTVRKLIYQAPTFEQGVFTGLVELSLELPEVLPHFVRAPKP